MNKNYISVILALIIIISSIILGFSNLKLNLQKMHTYLGITMILIVILGINTHLNRLLYRSPYNYIAWLHISIFSLFLFLSIKMIRTWNSKNIVSENFSNKFIVYFKGKKYDISDFVASHPGGSIINKSRNKNLEEVWKKNNVSWHMKNQNVLNVLKKYEA